MRLLIVEDDCDLASALSDAFARRNIASDHVETAGEGVAMLSGVQYAAVVLDLGLPDGDGRALLRVLRARHDSTPVLILTGKSSLEDRVDALDAGADDYLIKPFEMDELMARVRALLRRKVSFQGNELTFGDLRFDTVSRELYVRDKPVVVSPREAALIELFLRREGQVVTLKLARDHLFGQGEMSGFNAVEVNIHRLRRKLATTATSARIENIRGIGYLLRVTDLKT